MEGHLSVLGMPPSGPGFPSGHTWERSSQELLFSYHEPLTGAGNLHLLTRHSLRELLTLITGENLVKATTQALPVALSFFQMDHGIAFCSIRLQHQWKLLFSLDV